MNWLTTTAILDGLRSENDRAWSGLVERFRAPITRFARRMGHSADGAEDLAQETLLAAARRYRAGGYDRRRGRLRRWIFGIAYKQVLRDCRRAARRERPLPPELDLPAPCTGAETEDERRHEAAALIERLRRVRGEVAPATFRAFEMVVIENRPPADAAAALGIPIERVYAAKHRVLTRLCERPRERVERNPAKDGGARADTA